MVNPSPQNHSPGPCHAAVRWCASSLSAPAVLPRKRLKGGEGTLGVGRPLGCNYIIWDVVARGAGWWWWGGGSPTALPCCYGHRASMEGPSSSRMWNEFWLFFFFPLIIISPFQSRPLTDCAGARTGWGQAEAEGFTRNQSGGQKVGGTAGSTGGAGALLMGLRAQGPG